VAICGTWVVSGASDYVSELYLEGYECA